MKISITNIKTEPQYITIRASEYRNLIKSSQLYEQQKAKRSATMQAVNSKLSPEERSQAARKAAQARWNKTK